MNNNLDFTERGVPYKPSARKSIHHHNSYCPFRTYEVMGVYGLKENNKIKTKVGNFHRSLPLSEGTDEVDNIQSKFAHRSPVPIRKKAPRRNSFTSATHCNSDTSDDDDDRYDNSHAYSNNSADLSSDSLPGRSNGNYSGNSNTSQNLNYSSESSFHITNRSYRNSEKSNSGYFPMLWTLVALLVVVAAYYINIKEDTTNIVYDQRIFSRDLKQLGLSYNINSDSVLQVKTGISAIFQQENTGAFIIVYNSDNRNFDQLNFNNFVDDIASTAARFLRNDSDSNMIHHIVVESQNLDMNGHNQLINKYRNDVDVNGVMVVKEMDQVPSGLAMAFHYYCDEYSPLAKKSAIFFTLNLKNCATVTGNKLTSHSAIEKCLKSKWNSVPRDSIGPLLTRVVSVIIDVTDTF